jgi:uncharacterized membrane protein
MTKIHVSALVTAPIDLVWAQVRDFNAMPAWHPGFAQCHIDDGFP